MQIETKLLAEHFNPTQYDVWGCGLISKELVQQCIENNEFESESFQLWSGHVHNEAMFRQHARRIAYLVVNGWEDGIELDIGVPGYGHSTWPIIDGNHRLFAAIMRNDKHVKIEVSGSLDYFKELFSIEYIDEQEANYV